MDKKEIQQKRKKKYFLEGAKEIIREEGIKELTVKKVAARAGFAPGTLYNYFSDLEELFHDCALDFWEECRIYVKERTGESNSIKQEIIDFSKAYCDFFIVNPHVFELIFLQDIEYFKEVEPEAPQVAREMTKLFHEGKKNNLMTEEKRKLIENILGYSIHGMLLFHIKNRRKLTRKEFNEFIEKQIEFLLD